jgi:hypothetical protein
VIDLDQYDELDELRKLAGLSVMDAFTLRFRAKFAKKHPKLMWVFFALPFCLPVIGAIWYKKIGLLAGFFIGIFILWLGPYIYTKLARDKALD